MGRFQLNERVVPKDKRLRELYGPGYVHAIDVYSETGTESITVRHDNGFTDVYRPSSLEPGPRGPIYQANTPVTIGVYTTKDSGDRAEYASGMVRDTEAGKPRFDLLIPKGLPFSEQILTRFAALMARGAEKYDARNWEKAEGEEELERYYSSALRHLMQWITGETDEDHAAAVMFNLMAAETVKYKMANKPDPEPAAPRQRRAQKAPEPTALSAVAPVTSLNKWKAAVSYASRGSDCERCASRP